MAAETSAIDQPAASKGQSDLFQLFDTTNNDETKSDNTTSEEFKNEENIIPTTYQDQEDEVKIDKESLKVPQQTKLIVDGDYKPDLKKSLTFYSKFDQKDEELPLPYKQDCLSKLYYSPIL